MFKQLSVYRYEVPTELDGVEHPNYKIFNFCTDFFFAENILSDHKPADPEKSQYYTLGLLPIDDNILIESTDSGKHDGFAMVTKVKRERFIKQSAVGYAIDKKIAEVEAFTGEKIEDEARYQIIDDVTAEMLAKAPVVPSQVSGFVTADGWIMVNANGKAAEEYISYLREVFGSLSCLPVAAHEEYPGDLELTFYSRRMLKNFVEFTEEQAKESPFNCTGDFKFSYKKEKITMSEADATTVADVLDRLDMFKLSFIGLQHENMTCRLTDKLELRSIKLIDLAYEPEDDEVAGLTAAYYRFYKKLLRDKFTELMMHIREEGSL